ncbi:DNRLRE domain-containing protein [Streptomyces sp. NBC_01216]|uniref:CBM96 family carbohydrate-binding protein n=1 Tax=Streptomyces sp. NBC_01216 TaxID=2903778 RepID=UPI002E12FE4F|nr:DNRLRE domain-containing protein [Streptomyces sp. NBC_01216]
MLHRKATAVALVGVLASAALATLALTDLTPTASAAGTAFSPSADTYVDSGKAGTNYGTSHQLGVDHSPVKQMFLKFTVSGVSQPVTRATLRMHVDDVSGAQSGNGGTFQAMSNTTWSETSVTYNNKPSVDGAVLGSLGAVSRNTWYEVDVTSYVTGNGTYSVGVTSTSSDGADYDSRESGATAPQLLVETGSSPTPTPSTSTTPPSGDPVLVGAGDIATSGSGDSATANLLDGIPGTVFTTGDNAYPDGTASDFANYYDPTWGRHKARTRPAPGNHDYHTSGASAYYSYFGANAGTAGKGYYSYDLGNWHVVSLNSEVGMSVGSAQEQWLRADLAASTKPCTVAYWHKPRWTSSSSHGPDASTGPLVQALYDHDAELILTGHNHQYERFAPQNPSGQLDATHGIRQFVAGMGGASHYGFGTIQANSEARNSDTHGVLKLTLHAGGYDWEFVPEAGKTYNDSGTGTCH